MFILALVLALNSTMDSNVTRVPRNPFSYGKTCLEHPLCECIALGKIGACAFGLVSVNGILYTVKKGDIVTGYEVAQFIDKGIILVNNKNQELRLFLKQKALQLK